MSERERVLAWDDPAIGAAAMPGMSGLEYLHAMMGKKLPPPPMGELLNMTLVEAARALPPLPVIPTSPITTRSARFTAGSYAPFSIPPLAAPCRQPFPKAGLHLHRD